HLPRDLHHLPTRRSSDLGQISLGMMADSLKLRDVRRDPRVALHSPTPDPPKDDPSGWAGDAKLAGTVRSTGAPAENAQPGAGYLDRKSTRLNSSHQIISY